MAISLLCWKPPLKSRLVAADDGRQVVPQPTAEDDLGGQGVCVRFGGVPVNQERPGKLVDVHAASRPQDVHHQALGGLDSELCPLVGP